MTPAKPLLLLSSMLVSQLSWAGSDSSDVLKKICSGSCSGPMATIEVLANKEGAVKYYRFNGSLQSCSHPPAVVYDVKGNEVMRMAERPVDPKDLVQAKAIQKWQTFLKDLKKTETIWCDTVLKNASHLR